MHEKRTIIYHANCPDGFGSAWLLDSQQDGSVLYPASYGEPVPWDLINDAHVHLVDFCYETHQLVEILQSAASLTILDHHQTALGYVANSGIKTYSTVNEWLDDVDAPMGGAVAILDMDHSGVGLVQQYTGAPVPFLSHVEDRDLWRFALPNTAEVFAAVTSRPYTKEAWDAMERMPLEDLITEGRAITRYRDKLIADIVDTARIALLPTGHRVWVVASPYAVGSDVAGELAKRTPEMFAAYYVDTEDRIRFGLRSGPDGMDVAKIAEQLGGGGHKHASGFEVNRQWQGWA